MNNRWLSFIIYSIFVLLLFPSSSHAEERESIQQLLEKAEPGDTIRLENGVYQEDVIIHKTVTIIGSDETVIQGTGTGDVILIEADEVTLKNVTVRNSGTTLDHDFAGIKIRSHNNKIDNVNIEDSLHGIYLESSTGNEITNNTIIGNKQLNQSRRGNGIHLFESNNNRIEENMINGARDGIYFSFASHNQINKNRITNNRYGIHYMYSDYNRFFQNELFENTGGAAIMYSDYITLKENIFYDHHGLQSFGILLQTANDVLAEDNQVFFNTKGIFMDQSYRNVLKNNYIANNQIGLDIWNSSQDNFFTSNQLLDNKLQYTTNNGKDTNQWDKDGIGNAWSDYTFIDFNQDGIGDKSYVYQSTFGKVLSENQLGILFLYSPALDLYEKWNQITDGNEGSIIDQHPIPVTKTEQTTLPFIILLLIAFVLIWRLKRLKSK